jgi:hypothetical protein
VNTFRNINNKANEFQNKKVLEKPDLKKIMLLNNPEVMIKLKNIIIEIMITMRISHKRLILIKNSIKILIFNNAVKILFILP